MFENIEFIKHMNINKQFYVERSLMDENKKIKEGEKKSFLNKYCC